MSPRDHDRVGDRGSTIPLITGFFVVAALVVGGGIAAGDAFVDQRAVQATCDGATVAAASSLDLGALRGGDVAAGDAAPLAAVQDAARAYLDRDPDRADVEIDAELTADGTAVDATCTQLLPVTFGSVFGVGDGVRHVVTSSAATVLR